MRAYVQRDANESKEDAILRHAMSIMESRVRTYDLAFTNPTLVKNYVHGKLSHLEHEVFGVLFLNNQNQLIEYEEMFRGTIDGASVYPREVVKRALEMNAAAVIFTHNHPSGVEEASDADRQITNRLVKALGLMDIRVLDHLIVAGNKSVSFAEKGLL